MSFLHENAGRITALLGLITYTVFLTTSNCLEAFLRAERKLKKVVTAVILEKSLLLSLASGAVILFSSIWAVALAYLLAGLARVSFIGFTIFVRERLPVVRVPFDHVRRFAMNGVPFAFNTVALNVIPRFDTLLIASFSATAAGYFALGDRIVGPALIVPVVASTALYPYLSRERHDSSAGWQIAAMLMAAGVAVSIVGVALTPIVVPAVFGHRYLSAVPVVQLMVFVVPFVYASNPLLARLYTSGKERQVLGATLIASLIGTGAVLGGQLVAGPTGAAAGYVLRQALFTLTLAGIAFFPDARSSGRGLRGAGRAGT